MIEFNPQRSETDPNIYSWNGKRFDIRVLDWPNAPYGIPKGAAGLADFLEVPIWDIRQWLDRNRTRSWQENFTEAMADAARAKDRSTLLAAKGASR